MGLLELVNRTTRSLHLFSRNLRQEISVPTKQTIFHDIILGEQRQNPEWDWLMITEFTDRMQSRASYCSQRAQSESGLFAALFAWSPSVTPLQATTASPSINPIEMTAAYKAPLSRTVGRHLKFSRFPFVQFQFPPKTWPRSCAGAIFICRVSGSFQSALPKLTTPIRSQRPHRSSRNSLPTCSAETDRGH